MLRLGRRWALREPVGCRSSVARRACGADRGKDGGTSGAPGRASPAQDPRQDTPGDKLGIAVGPCFSLLEPS